MEKIVIIKETKTKRIQKKYREAKNSKYDNE